MKKKTSKNTAKYRDQYLRANFEKYYIRIPQLTFFRLWFSWIYQKYSQISQHLTCAVVSFLTNIFVCRISDSLR